MPGHTQLDRYSWTSPPAKPINLTVHAETDTTQQMPSDITTHQTDQHNHACWDIRNPQMQQNRAAIGGVVPGCASAGIRNLTDQQGASAHETHQHDHAYRDIRNPTGAIRPSTRQRQSAPPRMPRDTKFDRCGGIMQPSAQLCRVMCQRACTRCSMSGTQRPAPQRPTLQG